LRATATAPASLNRIFTIPARLVQNLLLIELPYLNEEDEDMPSDLYTDDSNKETSPEQEVSQEQNPSSEQEAPQGGDDSVTQDTSQDISQDVTQDTAS